MLQQILNDMYIEPELLAELDEEQKQILFCKMREEQVRRWREREEKLQKEENNRIASSRKKDGGKKVTFLMGLDGEPMVVVLGGEGSGPQQDVDSILEERAKRQADLEADMLKRAAEEELDKLVRLSRSTVEAMEEEATRTANSKVRDPAREAVVRSLQEATVEMEGQIQALEEAEAFQRKLSSSSSSSSSSGASSPSSPSPSLSSSSSTSSSSLSASSGIGSMGSPRLAMSSSPSTSSLSSLSSFTSSQPPSPPAFTISAYGTSTTSSSTNARRLGGGSGVSMWDAVNRASHIPSSSSASSSTTTTSSTSSSSASVLSSSNFSSVVKPPILTPKPTTVPPPQPLRASQPSTSPPSSLSSTTSTISSTSSSSPPSSAAEMEQPTSSPPSVVGVAAQIRRFEQLSEGSLEALKTATLERAKKRREREIFEHLRSQVEAARQQAASADFEAASKQQQAAEKDDIAWQEQERKAKEAERRIREIARRAREEHRRASQNTPPSSPPASALNYNLNGFTRLTNGINGASHATTIPPAGDINGNVNSVADDISNNNDSISLKKYSSNSSCSSSPSSPGSPGLEGFCIRQRLRPPKPPSRAAIITWFRDEELPRGAGLDPSCSRIAPWFHGIISRTEAEEVLSEAGIGCFLVRVSERIWGYAISYRAPDRCRHYLIDVTGGKYTFFGSHQASHNSLGDLIEHHKREAITVSGGELLTRPCGQMHPRNPDYRELFSSTPYLAA